MSVSGMTFPMTCHGFWRIDVSVVDHFRLFFGSPKIRRLFFRGGFPCVFVSPKFDCSGNPIRTNEFVFVSPIFDRSGRTWFSSLK